MELSKDAKTLRDYFKMLENSQEVYSLFDVERLTNFRSKSRFDKALQELKDKGVFKKEGAFFRVK